jgi:hypothetical protein
MMMMMMMMNEALLGYQAASIGNCLPIFDP